MRLKALARSGTGMTDQQCEVDKMCGLRGRRELTITQVAKLVRTGWSRLICWSGKVPGGANSYHFGRFCAGGRVAQATAGGWWWTKEAATKSWRRDVRWQVSSLFSGLMNRTTIPARGAFSTGRVPVGRGR